MDKKKTDKKEFCKLYREARQSLGLTQIALAKSAGLSSDKLARWEKGRAKFNDEEITRLNKAFDAVIIARAESIKGPLKDSTAENVRSLRLAYGITQEELARRAIVTQASISLFENGYDVFDAEEANEIYVACKELVRERESARPNRLSSLGSFGSLGLGCAQPVPIQESTEERLQKEIVRLNKKLANAEEMEALQDKIINELKTEIARLELLNKALGESKDREIRALREQLEATNKSVTIPPDDTWDSGEE